MSRSLAIQEGKNLTGQEIRVIREQLRLSQRKFAERLGVGRRTVIRWESDLTTPDKEAQDKLMQLTQKVTGDTLVENVTGKGDTPNKNVTGEKEKVTGKSDILDERVTGDTPKSDIPNKNVTGDTPKSDTPNKRVTGDTPKSDIPNKNVTGDTPKSDTPNKKVTGDTPKSDTPNKNVTGDRADVTGKTENVTGKSDRVDVQFYYKTMYEDARGIIPLCITNQPQDRDKKPSLQVKGFYDISQIPSLLAEADRLSGNYHIYTGIHPLRERPSEGRGKEKDILGIALFAADVDAKDFIEDKE